MFCSSEKIKAVSKFPKEVIVEALGNIIFDPNMLLRECKQIENRKKREKLTELDKKSQGLWKKMSAEKDALKKHKLFMEIMELDKKRDKMFDEIYA